jgi:hypothetical protein
MAIPRTAGRTEPGIPHYPLVIDGSGIEAESGRRYDTIDPSRDPRGPPQPAAAQRVRTSLGRRPCGLWRKLTSRDWRIAAAGAAQCA